MMRMMKQFLLESAFIKNFSTRMHLPQGLTSTCFLKNCDLTKGLAMQRPIFCCCLHFSVLGF